jgi:hypothetical protein
MMLLFRRKKKMKRLKRILLKKLMTLKSHH